MLHEIGVQLKTALGAAGCGFDVVDGPERRKPATFARERIVIEHDTSPDSFTSRHKADTKAANTRLTRLMACKLTIFAQNPSKGSAEWEHRRRAEVVLDMVLIALDVIAKQRMNLWVPKSGKFVYPDDLKESETPGGAIYELLFTFDRGVTEHTFAGANANDDGSLKNTVPISPFMQGGPSVTFAATGHTITRSFGSFLTDGFAVGVSVIVAGSTSNNGTIGPITALTDTVMTFGAGIVNEGPDTGVTITGTGPIVHNTFSVTGSTQGGGTSTETA